MALDVGGLTNDLTDIYEKMSSSIPDAANQYTSAVIKYWNTGMAPAAGTITADPARATLYPAVLQAYSLNRSSAQQAATLISQAMGASVPVFIAAGGLYGTGPCAALGTGALQSALVTIYSSLTGEPKQAAQQEAQAIHAFTLATLCTGTGVETPVPIPKIGPIS